MDISVLVDKIYKEYMAEQLNNLGEPDVCDVKKLLFVEKLSKEQRTAYNSLEKLLKAQKEQEAKALIEFVISNYGTNTKA